MASKSVKRRPHLWSINFSKSRGESAFDLSSSPPGYTDRDLPDKAAEDADDHKSLVAKKFMDVATAPLKQLPMNLFMMWMAGNTVSIFPIMMVGMMLWRPVQALISVHKTFQTFQDSPNPYVNMCIYVFGNLSCVAVALYKCSSMGLLPTHASDWLAFLDPQQRMEYSDGGFAI